MTEEIQVYQDRKAGKEHQAVLVLQELKATSVVLAVQEIQANLDDQVSFFSTVWIVGINGY